MVRAPIQTMIPVGHLWIVKTVFASVLILSLAAGCSGYVSNTPQRSAAFAQTARGYADSSMALPPSASTVSAGADNHRLQQLAVERMGRQPTDSYRLGPEDLIEVRVFDLPEMNQVVRVGMAGQISLPLIGAVQAGGRSTNELAAEITTKLQSGPVKKPQVDVFIQEYKSQLVSVTGAVAKPGLYPLTRTHYTILDLLGQAGGPSKEAGSVIEIIPGHQLQMASASPGAPRQLPPAVGPAGREAIPISLQELLSGSNKTALTLPVLAGDVIFVPEAGSFSVEGWVDKPGTYPITRNMTVLNAISTAGGPLFPAQLSAVQVFRKSDSAAGGREVLTVNASSLEAGEVLDLTLKAGDVVHVPPIYALVPPWAFYTVLRDFIRFGIGATLIGA